MIGGVRQYESAGNEQICIGKGALGRSFTCDWEGTGKVLVVEACQEWETGKAVRQELGGENLFPGDGREREHGAWVGSMDDEEERLGELLFLFFSLFLSFFLYFYFYFYFSLFFIFFNIYLSLSRSHGESLGGLSSQRVPS